MAALRTLCRADLVAFYRVRVGGGWVRRVRRVLGAQLVGGAQARVCVWWGGGARGRGRALGSRVGAGGGREWRGALRCAQQHPPFHPPPPLPPPMRACRSTCSTPPPVASCPCGCRQRGGRLGRGGRGGGRRRGGGRGNGGRRRGGGGGADHRCVCVQAQAAALPFLSLTPPPHAPLSSQEREGPAPPARSTCPPPTPSPRSHPPPPLRVTTHHPPGLLGAAGVVVRGVLVMSPSLRGNKIDLGGGGAAHARACPAAQWSCASVFQA